MLKFLVSAAAIGSVLGITDLMRKGKGDQNKAMALEMNDNGIEFNVQREQNEIEDNTVCTQGAQLPKHSHQTFSVGPYTTIHDCQAACKASDALEFTLFDVASALAKGKSGATCRCSKGGEPMIRSGFLAVSGSVDCVPKCSGDHDARYLFCVDLLDQPGQSCSCLDSCPKGFIKVEPPSSSGPGNCVACEGSVSADRTQCNDCAAGYIPLEGSDACQRFQDTCKPEDCNKCESCMSQIAPELAAGPEGCFHPGTQWGPAWAALAKCQVEGPGCFFKILCQYECVCSLWKDTFCGGRTGEQSCQGSLLAKNTSLPTPEGNDQEVSAGALDEALSGKRSC